MFDDPNSTQATFRSTSRSALSKIDLNILQPPAMKQTRSIWIKFTGPRADNRSRSASPRGSVRDEWGDAAYEEVDKQPLPRTVQICAMAVRTRTGRERYNVIFKLDESVQPFQRREEPIVLKEVNLGRRFKEKEIIDTMSEIFCDVYRISPPSQQTNYGWVVTGGDPWDMEQFKRASVSLASLTRSNCTGFQECQFVWRPRWSRATLTTRAAPLVMLRMQGRVANLNPVAHCRHQTVVQLATRS